MAKFIKHVGKHNDRKVAVIFREIPGETHMCLVVYTELINRNIHDPLITCIESNQGQAAENLGDALNRAYTTDGKIILQVLHSEGMMKKVQTSQIVMTPHPNQSVRLSELNTILDEMAKGSDAVKKLAEMDASRGLQDPKDVKRRQREAANAAASLPSNAPVNPQDYLGNESLAANLRRQAEKMGAEAQGLLAEAQRLSKEAAQLEGVKPEKKTKAKKVTTVTAPIVEVVPAKKAGRVKKVSTVS